MKKILTSAIALLMTLTVSAQENATTFMGIPIKGSASIMRSALVQKGFVLNKDYTLMGCVDGDSCNITIDTDKGKVVSITAVNMYGTNSIREAIEKYDALLDFYKEDCNYTEYETNDYIHDTDIETYKRNIGNEYYYAEFFQVCEPQKFTRRLSFKLTAKHGDYRIVRCYDNGEELPL